MSITARILFGAGATWFSRGLQIILGLILLPVLFRMLPNEELGIWLLLGQSWAAMGILDLGFGVTLTRRIALTKGKNGPAMDAYTPETRREIADLVATGRRIYGYMALGVFLISWVPGIFYLRHLDFQDLSHGSVWIAWTILCACQALTVRTAVWTCLLQGIGYIGSSAIIASCINAATLIAQILAVLCGGGLIALATTSAVAVLFQRSVTRWFTRRRRPDLFSIEGKWNPAELKGVPNVAFHAWLTTAGSILIFNTDQFFIAALEGAEGIPAYRAAYLVVLNLNMLAITLASTSSVFVSYLWQTRELKQVHRIVQRNARLGLLIMLCGCACVLSLGSTLFDLWIGPGKFIGYPTLIVFCALLVLETNSSIIAASSRATEDEAFAFSTLTAGIVKLSLSWILMQHYGLLGIATGTLIAQLLTNSWFISYRGLRRLRMSLREHFKGVLIPVAIAFGLVLTCNAGALSLVHSASPFIQLLVAVGITAAVFIGSCWMLVLAQSERARIRSILALIEAPANL